jgi:DNA-directed RNA polymerase subunit RPC12/RpoP
LLSNSLDLQETLVEEIPSWTIQVIYPEDRNPDSILSETDTLISVESVQEAIVEEEKPMQEVVATEAPERAKRPTRDTLPYADCWTPKGYTCPNCQKIYNARKNLARHINSECGKEPQYACPYCEYKNYRRNEIKKHAKNKHHLLFT